MSKLKKDITDCYFVLYDLNDFDCPLYFDNIFEFLKFNYMDTSYVKRFRYKFHNAKENYITIKLKCDNNCYWHLYAFEK